MPKPLYSFLFNKNHSVLFSTGLRGRSSLMFYCLKLSDWEFSLSFFFFNVYLFLRKTETEWEWVGAEREGGTESEAGSRLRALSTEPEAGLEPTDREITT